MTADTPGAAGDDESGRDGVAAAAVKITWMPEDFGLSMTFPSTTTNAVNSSRWGPGIIDGRRALHSYLPLVAVVVAHETSVSSERTPSTYTA